MFDQPIQLEVFLADLHLRRIDPACNMRRFYLCVSFRISNDVVVEGTA